MPDISHAGLTADADLHEPKGANAASANTVYVADGATSGTFKKIVLEDSADTAGGTSGQILVNDGAGSFNWKDAPGAIPHGELTLGETTNNSTATTVTNLDTYYIVAGTWTENAAENGVTTTVANGRFTVADGGSYDLQCDLSYICSRNADIVTFRFMKNGTAFGPRIRRKIGTGVDVGATTIHAHAHSVVATDYFQIGVTLLTGEGANTAGDTVTIENASFNITMIEAA